MDPVITIFYPPPGNPHPCDICNVNNTRVQIGTRYGRGEGVHLCGPCLFRFNTDVKRAAEAVRSGAK